MIRTQALTRFPVELEFDAIPSAVRRRMVDLFLDWIASALAEFNSCLGDWGVRDFAERVRKEIDSEVDAAYSARWIGKVTVVMRDGRRIAARVNEPKGDLGNMLSRVELENMVLRLAFYRQGADCAEMRRIIDMACGLKTQFVFGERLPALVAVRGAA